MTCTKCERPNLTASDFHRNSRGKLRGSCRFCKRDYDRARKVTHRVEEHERPSDLMEYKLRIPSRMVGI